MMINFGNNEGTMKNHVDLTKSEYRKTTTGVNKTRQNLDNQAKKQLFDGTKMTVIANLKGGIFSPSWIIRLV